MRAQHALFAASQLMVFSMRLLKLPPKLKKSIKSRNKWMKERMALKMMKMLTIRKKEVRPQRQPKHKIPPRMIVAKGIVKDS